MANKSEPMDSCFIFNSSIVHSCIGKVQLYSIGRSSIKKWVMNPRHPLGTNISRKILGDFEPRAKSLLAFTYKVNHSLFSCVQLRWLENNVHLRVDCVLQSLFSFKQSNLPLAFKWDISHDSNSSSSSSYIHITYSSIQWVNLLTLYDLEFKRVIIIQRKVIHSLIHSLLTQWV